MKPDLFHPDNFTRGQKHRIELEIGTQLFFVFHGPDTGLARLRLFQLGTEPLDRLLFGIDVLSHIDEGRFGRVAIAARRILVSPRRWQRTGVASQTLRNWSLTALAAAGIAPNRLARFYPPVR